MDQYNTELLIELKTQIEQLQINFNALEQRITTYLSRNINTQQDLLMLIGQLKNEIKIQDKINGEIVVVLEHLNKMYSGLLNVSERLIGVLK